MKSSCFYCICLCSAVRASSLPARCFWASSLLWSWAPVRTRTFPASQSNTHTASTFCLVHLVLLTRCAFHLCVCAQRSSTSSPRAAGSECDDRAPPLDERGAARWSIRCRTLGTLMGRQRDADAICLLHGMPSSRVTPQERWMFGSVT